MYRVIRVTPVWFFFLVAAIILTLQYRWQLVPPISALLIPVYLIVGVVVNLATYCRINRVNYKAFLSAGLIRDVFSTSRAFHAEWRHQVKIVVLEEIVWRVIPVLVVKLFVPDGYGMAILMLVSVCFTILHFYHHAEIYVVLLVEFFAYFTALYFLYFWWTDFMMIFIFHWIRNEMIFFIRIGYVKLQKQDEAGAEARG